MRRVALTTLVLINLLARFVIRGFGSAMAALRCPAFDRSKRQVFVVGNEAADVDSLVSAFAMAKLLHREEVQAFALAQIPRREFRLRGDAMEVFQRARCEFLADGPVELIFWDEMPGEIISQLETRALVLTDHNVMTPKVAELFEGKVTWILDHHADASRYPEAKRDVDPSLGSACTLIAEQYLRDRGEVASDVAVLLLGAILLDTRNFNPNEKKGTPRDLAAYNALAKFMPEGETATSWYDKLMEARKDVSHLSIEELQLLDVKVSSFGGRSVAFANIMMSMSVCLERWGVARFVEAARVVALARAWQAVVCFFSPDKQRQKRRGLLLIPVEASSLSTCQSLLANLKAEPSELSDELKANPLFKEQGILEIGFDVQDAEDLKPYMAFTIQKAISRKTLLPAALGSAL